jgi:uncharacterized protein (DUF433 family)
MTFDFDKAATLRIMLQEDEVQELLERFPKLSRTEITDVISRTGPMRSAVEAELSSISRLKR